jgi:predicted DNA-binding transcriptional regulator AlpA
MSLPKCVLRMKDLRCVGINNWPTLKRRILKDNFPPGRYVGANTRVWDEAEVERWWATRPSAAPPENVKPAAASPAREVSNGRETKSPLRHPEHIERVASEVAWPGGSRQRWVARVGDRASEPLPLDAAKQAAIAFLRERGKAEPRDLIAELDQVAANEVDGAVLQRERRKWPLNIMGGGRQRTPCMTIEPKAIL